MNKVKRYKILSMLEKKNPNPCIELTFNSPFELLIAVLLSAKTTDMIVNQATTKLYLLANTPEDMLNLGLDGIKNVIKIVGLYNRKALNIINISHIILEKYRGKVPNDRTALEALPGVGRKTANVILNTAFGWPTIAVDTHVFRVCNRTRFALGKNVLKLEAILHKLVPSYFKKNCHLWLMLHGRYICRARHPHCASCIIQDLCEYNLKKNTR
ncbi:MAG: endonuclease III [Candidatus Dasytiphilus stammeri]